MPAPHYVLLLLLLAILLCSLPGTSTAAAHSPRLRVLAGHRKTRPPQPSNRGNPHVSTIVLKDPPVEYACTLAVHDNSVIERVKGLEFLARKATSASTLVSECSLQCITNSNRTSTCVGFVKDSALGCSLAFSQGIAPNLVALPGKRGNTFSASAVILNSNCYDAQTATPTPEPTEPRTPAPTPEPTRFISPDCTLAPGSKGFGVENFQRIPTNTSLCEIAQLAGLGISMYRYDNYTCGLAGCLGRCNNDGYCKYALYSDKKKTCYKSTMMRVTDSPEQILSYLADEWQPYRKIFQAGGDPTVEYYGGFCTNKVPSSCSAFPQWCAWDEGKRGSNAYTMGGNAGGYCGRIACTASTSRTPTFVP